MSSTIQCGAANIFWSSGTRVLTLFNVQSEVIRKSANFIDLPMPVADSDEKIIFDLMGTSREISITGKVSSADVTPSTLTTYANDLVGLKGTYQSLINGTQGNTGSGQIGYTYTSDILGTTITVFVQDVSITWEAGNPNSLNYSMTLFEASATDSG